MRLALFLLALVAAPEPCVRELAFEPRQAAVMMPLSRYDFKVRARVESHADHRVLDLSWDGPQAGRSVRQLAGDEEPVTHRFEFKDLPGGSYVFALRVINNEGKVVGRAELKTLFMEGDSDR